MLFLFRLGALRRLRYDLGTPEGIANLNRVARVSLETFPHPDTLEYFLKGVAPEGIARVRREMTRDIIRSRALEPFRLRGRFYLVAVDGTWLLTFDKPHCPRCLVQEREDGTKIYYHPVLEAKLVCENGLSMSIATEFIENTDGAKKQDCELAAFKRLVPRLREEFSNLPICLLLDSLYLNQNVMRLCAENRIHYIATFKQGSLPGAHAEFQALHALCSEQSLSIKDPAPGVERRYRWLNGLDHEDNAFNAFECAETIHGKTTTFLWATDLEVNEKDVVEMTHRGGRLRWKIENEGFNTQKNQGYELEHAYSKNETAAKNFYLLPQIAHTISQLIEKGNLLGKDVKKRYGSSRALSLRLQEAFRLCLISADRWAELLAVKYRIRFNAS